MLPAHIHVHMHAHTHAPDCYGVAAVFNSRVRYQGVLRDVDVREGE